jgi:hypothetical protein
VDSASAVVDRMEIVSGVGVNFPLLPTAWSASPVDAAVSPVGSQPWARSARRMIAQAWVVGRRARGPARPQRPRRDPGTLAGCPTATSASAWTHPPDRAAGRAGGGAGLAAAPGCPAARRHHAVFVPRTPGVTGSVGHGASLSGGCGRLVPRSRSDSSCDWFGALGSNCRPRPGPSRAPTGRANVT